MYWELGFLRVFLCTIVSPYFIVESLQLRGRRQIAESRKYCLVRVIVFFDVCFLYLFCFSQVGILVKFPTLISLKEEILRKCDGSPQAIVVLAGLLSTRNLTKWSSVIEHAFLEENIFASSYDDLSPQIKSCFLYLGLFP